MKIKDMFYKEIDRDIKGVIKVGQADDENVYQELDEYVVTSELESYMMKFFQAYINGLENRTDKMGVWISGFFGSGKSHFLKILSYLLDNKQVYDEEGKLHNATSFFTEGVKVQNTDLKKEIQTIADYSNDVDVILFNIDSKSESDSKMNKEAMKDRLKSSVGCISITIPSLKVLRLEKKVKLQKRRFLQLHSYSHQTGLYGIWSKTVWGVYG